MATMTAEARAALNAYQREWRKNNKDKEREYRARHWEKKAQQLAAEREAAQNEKRATKATVWLD